MKRKAWSLVGGLVASATIGTTLLTDTLTRPTYAQEAAASLSSYDYSHDLEEESDLFLNSNDHDEEFIHHDLLETDRETDGPKVLELDVHIRPTNSVSLPVMALFSEESSEENNELDDNGAGFLEKNLSDFFDI